MLKFLSFLQPKSINNVCELLQLLGSRDPLPGFCPWTPLGDFHPKTLLAIAPWVKIAGVATDKNPTLFLVLTIQKLYENYSVTFWPILQTDRQTHTQTNRNKNIISLAENLTQQIQISAACNALLKINLYYLYFVMSCGRNFRVAR